MGRFLKALNFFVPLQRYRFSMVQEILIFVLFALAAAYMLKQGYNSFFKKTPGCAKGCGACGTIDFEKISADLDKKMALKK